MAPTHVGIWEVFPFHEPCLGAPASLLASLRTYADFAGKDAGAPRFIAPIHVQSLELFPAHEPTLHPSLEGN